MPKTEWKSICAACAEGTAPGRCAYYGDPNGCNAPTLGQHPEGDLAERLYEALEKAERRIAELERTIGNYAEMREALEYVRDLMRGIKDGDRISSFAFLGVVEHALAAPARNCDVGKADDLHASFVRHCDACDPPGGCCHRKDPRGMLDTNCASILKCFARFVLAKKEGGKE